jgi:hypothetical protein
MLFRLAHRHDGGIITNMKNVIRSTVMSLLLSAASMLYGAVPGMTVTVSDANGKAAFKGTTDASGAFTTANLKSGNYVVQFNSDSGAMNGKYYALVVSAGKKKVSATAVPGEKFAGGGVAMRVDVGTGLNITGQVATEADGAMKNGKKMVWIPKQLGSNRPAHWAEEGSADAIAAKNAGSWRIEDVVKMQAHTDQP